jgi:hypothetical protein
MLTNASTVSCGVSLPQMTNISSPFTTFPTNLSYNVLRLLLFYVTLL